MKKKTEVKEFLIEGKKLQCQICGHTRFWTRETLMNTPGMSFFGLDWANRSALNYICDKCGYVNWFFRG